MQYFFFRHWVFRHSCFALGERQIKTYQSGYEVKFLSAARLILNEVKQILFKDK